LSEFQVAGDDGKFSPATATIDGNTVVVSSDKVSKPAQAQFGWHKVANPNLSNKEGLPASPFRTKDWRGATGE
jgi:sialate O-acetylesterase